MLRSQFYLIFAIGLASCELGCTDRAPSAPKEVNVHEMSTNPDVSTFVANAGPASDESSAHGSLSEAKLKEPSGRDLGLFSIQKGTGDQLQTLVAVDGEVRLLRFQVFGTQGIGSGEPKKYPYQAESYPWRITRTAQGYTLQSIGQGMQHHGWYLSFNREIPAKGVFLAKRPGVGSYWNMDEVPAFTERDATPLRAGIAGADWELDCEPDGETYVKEAIGYFTVCHLRLVQRQGTRWKIDFYGK